MRSLVLALCALTACASGSTTRPLALRAPHISTEARVSAVNRQQGVAIAGSVVAASTVHPLQFPRTYWVGSELWTVFSTMAQDSMEVHVARRRSQQSSFAAPELVTAPEHHSSAYASLAVAPDRVAFAFDDDAYNGRMTRFELFARPAAGEQLEQTLFESGIWASTSEASIAWSPALQEWGTFAGSSQYVWSTRHRANGTFIEGTGLRLPNLRYVRRCGERFLWADSSWVALVHDEQLTFTLVERDAQRHRVRSLGLRAIGTINDAALAFDRGRYALVWTDEEGVKFSIAHDAQQHSPVQLLAPRERNPDCPVVAFDGQRFVVVWTETVSSTPTLLRRAHVSAQGIASPSELFASDPAQHVWWPHVSPRTEGRPLAYTYQVGQSEARVWIDRAE